MPKPRLRLIVCSQAIAPEASRRRRFRPAVIDGGRRTNFSAENPLEGLLDLFDLGVLVAQANYLAWLAATLAAISHRRPEPERAG
jgi:hypothetical protein